MFIYTTRLIFFDLGFFLFLVKQTKGKVWLGTNYIAPTRNFNCLVKAFSSSWSHTKSIRNKSKRARSLRGLAYLILRLNSILRAMIVGKSEICGQGWWKLTSFMYTHSEMLLYFRDTLNLRHFSTVERHWFWVYFYIFEIHSLWETFMGRKYLHTIDIPL